MSRHRLLGVVLLAGAWLGCLDWTGPGNPRSSPVLVSDTASATAVSASAATSSADRSLGATSGTDVAYISLAPGTTPAGRVATVRNLGNGSIVAVPLDAGGFDPVAVRAAVGDTIDIAVRDASGTLVLQTLVVVTAARAPVVVRTNPPPRKRDVPLNAAIVIVFSEPIDPSTLTGESVRLLRGTATVAARLEFRDPARLTATLLPDAPLAAGTDYKLELTQGIRDLDGDALDMPHTVPFTTGSTVLQAASVTIVPDTLRAVGSPVEAWVQAIVRDANGNELLNVPVRWSSSNPGVLPLEPTGTFEAGRNKQFINYAGGAAASEITATTSDGRVGTGAFVFDTVPLSAVSVGANGGACALSTRGRAFCAGGNQEGELGIGATGGGSGELIGIAGDFAFAAISTGFAHRCALTAAGAAYCWGWNSYGEVGVPPSDAEPRPVPVSGGLTFRQITTGFTHTCGLTESGAAYCWGGGSEIDNRGQLGNGSTSNSSTPIAVVGGLTFTEISAGEGNHTCGLTPNGEAYCWGWNAYGQLGNGSFTDSPSPMAVAGGIAFAHISAGDAHTCAVTADGSAYCWGDQGAGWAPGMPASSSPQPMQLPDGVALAQIDAGYNATCALTADGAPYCWGFHPGSNGPDFWQAPAQVAVGTRFRSVSSGYFKWCGITLEPHVYCELWSMAP